MANSLRIKANLCVIEMDREFSKRAKIYGSQEYNMLQQARRDYPTFQVVNRTITKTDKVRAIDHYKGLDYAYIEAYIATHDNAEDNFAVYKEKRLQAEGHSIRFPAIRQWFLDTYPEVKVKGVSADERKEAETAEKKARIIKIQKLEMRKKIA